MALVLAAMGCGNNAPGEGTGEILMVDYLALELDGAWTFRDDDSTEDPEEDELIRARLSSEDTLELRRGARWADAEDAGMLAFDTRYGLSLVEFDLAGLDDGLSGSGDWAMADFDPVTGEYQGSGTWGCTTDTGTEVETWYATFEDVVRLDCSSTGGDGLPGTWDFARGIGLVRYEHPDGLLVELVAPY